MIKTNLLFIADGFMLLSGASTMAREIMEGTSHVYNWVQLGVGINHPYAGQRIDMSEKVNATTGNTDSSVVIYPYNSYGDPQILRRLIKI